MADVKITIIDNINGEIRRHGMTKESFCKLLGVERSTYTNWQTKGDLPAHKLLECAKIFGCSMDYLVRDVDFNIATEEIRIS